MINDNPASLALTGQVKEKTGCVICMDQTEPIYLPSSSKLVYMWHRRFLPPKHRYRQWVKHPQGVEIDDYGFTIVDLTNVGHKDEPWVLAATVAQVFYILDPKDEKKYIVVPGKQRVVRVDDVENEEEYNQCDEVPFFVDTRMINIIEIKISYSNVIPYARTDGERKMVHV
jgi:hypothetical protein